ncbi:MAG: hypothetical protein IT289_01615 [Oligoflexia bacterium]|nr:hypothetical protein [Oligoflexia bacterium]
MKIIDCDFNEALLLKSFDLQKELMGQFKQWPLPQKDHEVSFYSSQNPMNRHTEVRHFMALSGDQVRGSVTAFIDKLLPAGQAVLGRYVCENRPETSKALLGAAVEWLKTKSINTVIGPADYGIWAKYRFKTDAFDLPYYGGEPVNPPYYPQQWESFGFKKDARWRTWEVSRSNIEAMHQMCIKRAEGVQGWRVERILVEDELTFQNYHRLLIEIFSENYLATGIDYLDFKFCFGSLMKALPLIHLFFIIGPDNKAHGLALGHPDFGKAYKDAHGGAVTPALLMNAAETTDSYILNMMGIDKESRQQGVVDLLFKSGLYSALERPRERYYGYLVREGKSIYSHFGPHQREYWMYKLEI